MTMDINDIYAEYTIGSTGFVRAVETYCAGYDLSQEEIERIAAVAKTGEEFQNIWENENWWVDADRK